MNLGILLLIVLFSMTINAIILLISKDDFLNDIDKGSKLHAIHVGRVPRIGGVSIFISFVLVCFFKLSQFLGVLLLAFMVFLIGLLEDIKKDISPKLRLGVLFISSILSILLMDVTIHNIGFGEIPPIVSFFLSVIAITGFANAINIIDGLNGLAAGISATFLFFLGITFYKYGYLDLAFLCFSVIAGIVGFLIFNFPYGKIFLGDGGAYFLGFICAVLSIKLINEIPEISPWFPFMLGVYPVWEVLFSAYRRLKKEKHPFYPDKLHFHTLVFYRITKSNPKASAILLAVNFIFSLLAFLIKSCTICLVFEFLIFIVLYLATYKYLVRTASLGSIGN